MAAAVLLAFGGHGHGAEASGSGLVADKDRMPVAKGMVAFLVKGASSRKSYHWCNRCNKAAHWTGEDCPLCGASMEQGDELRDPRKCPKGHIFDAGDSDEGDSEQCPRCGSMGKVTKGLGARSCDLVAFLLGKAVQNPLSDRTYRRGHDRQFAVAKQNSRGWLNSLKPHERAAFDRHMDDSAEPDDHRTMESALARARLPKEQTVYRGMHVGAMGLKHTDQIQVGHEFVAPTTWPSSVHRGKAGNFYPGSSHNVGVMAHIHLPSGFPTAMIDPEREQDEGEMPLMRGTRFRVTHIRRAGRGVSKNVVHLEAVAPEREEGSSSSIAKGLVAFRFRKSVDAGGHATVRRRIAAARADTHPEPSRAQKEAGNYKMGANNDDTLTALRTANNDDTQETEGTAGDLRALRAVGELQHPEGVANSGHNVLRALRAVGNYRMGTVRV